jgi:Rieske Fe-S protein
MVMVWLRFYIFVVLLATRVFIINLPRKGLLAYSDVCTHLSCSVVYEREGKLHYPCHDGLLDAVTGNVLAGPPLRPLPMTPLAISNGTIYVVKEVAR